MWRSVFAASVVTAGVTLTSVVAADCFMMTGQNPQTGHAERATAVSDGHDLEIEWSEQIGSNWSQPTLLSQNLVDDSCPQLAFSAAGATGSTWREAGATGRVVYAARIQSGGAWVWQLPAIYISDGANDASGPSLAFVGNQPWLAWHEIGSSGSTKIMVAGGEGLEPWPTAFNRFELGSTNFTGPVAVGVQRESGHLWVTWVQSATELRYRERDLSNGVWLAASSVAIQGGDVGQAAATARLQVLN